MTASRISVVASHLTLARRRVSRRHKAAVLTNMLKPCILKTKQICTASSSRLCAGKYHKDCTRCSLYLSHKIPLQQRRDSPLSYFIVNKSQCMQATMNISTGHDCTDTRLDVSDLSSLPHLYTDPIRPLH